MRRDKHCRRNYFNVRLIYQGRQWEPHTCRVRKWTRVFDQSLRSTLTWWRQRWRGVRSPMRQRKRQKRKKLHEDSHKWVASMISVLGKSSWRDSQVSSKHSRVSHRSVNHGDDRMRVERRQWWDLSFNQTVWELELQFTNSNKKLTLLWLGTLDFCRTYAFETSFCTHSCTVRRSDTRDGAVSLRCGQQHERETRKPPHFPALTSRMGQRFWTTAGL